MLRSEKIAVCFEIHTKYMNNFYGQNAEFFSLNLAVHNATTGL